MNVLLTCAGRRNYLIEYFRTALGGSGLVCATDASPDAPAMQEADHAFLVPKVDADDYVDSLLDVCRQNGIGLLVSLNDLELPVLAAARDRFSRIGVVAAVSSPEAIDTAFDKWRTAAFLASCGLRTCATHLTLEDAHAALDRGALSFPLVVKPRWGTASIGVDVVHDPDELELSFRLAHRRLSRTFLAKVSSSDRERSIMIQECLTGQEYGLDIVNDLVGNTVAVFVKRKLAMRAGETDRAVTVCDSALEEVGFVIGRKLKHVGNLDCDAFLTADGPRVLELNPRFGGGYPFSHAAGANIPAALVAWSEGRRPDPRWLQVAPGVCSAKCDRLVRRSRVPPAEPAPLKPHGTAPPTAQDCRKAAPSAERPPEAQSCGDSNATRQASTASAVSSVRRLFLSPPHMEGMEQAFVRQAFDSNYIAPLGPMVDAFEREFAEHTGIPHCLALSSGTAATHLALRHLLGGLTADRRPLASDRPLVLASTLTFIGSVTPAVFEGCDITFIDCDRETWNMDVALLEEELAECEGKGRLPAAVIPTDLYGQSCNLPRIVSLCDRYGVPVICDSAEAVGARYQRSVVRSQKSEGSEAKRLTSDLRPPTSDLCPPTSGLWAHAGFDARAAVYSFNGNKIITTSGGGMLASHDKDLIDHARKLSQQARDPAPWYEHTEIGFNYRMSNILAAIGRGQLQMLDERVRRRREVFDGYRRSLGELPGLAFMPEPDWCRSNRWLTVTLIDARTFGASPEDVRLTLETENIESRPVWKPMHLQPVFAGCRVRGGAVAEDLFARGLCLPSGTAMSEDDIGRVCDTVRRLCAGVRGVHP